MLCVDSFIFACFYIMNRDHLAKLRDSIRIRIGCPIRFESEWPIRKFSIKSALPAPLFVVSLVKRLKPLTALGTVYRLASSMSDHTLVVASFVITDFSH